MKSIPLELITAFAKPGKSTCFLVRIKDTDGDNHGFTNLDAVVRFDDGDGELVYLPNHELNPMNIQNSLDMEVDNTELVGWFGTALEELVLAGKFMQAEISVYRISYLRTEYGCEVVAYGTVGTIEYSANTQSKRKIEYRGLGQKIKAKVNDVFSLTCRASFGDEDCRMPFVWETGTIIDVEDNFMRFRVSGITRPNDWFVLGVCEFLSGPNSTAQLEIESWSADGWLTLGFVSSFAVENGVSLRLRRDCDKTETACLDYGNIVNMQAEHLSPVQDQSIMVPGAYIKSQNAV